MLIGPSKAFPGSQMAWLGFQAIRSNRLSNSPMKQLEVPVTVYIRL